MAGAGIRNMGTYMRKMALCGYVLQIDLAPVRELVSLQRDYSALWGPLSDLLKQLSALVEL